ncbi:MAG: homoserine dehydrogenase [Clostridia bacterium]|nr:homoserine dehydrogenase [Clostridia bacterium]
MKKIALLGFGVVGKGVYDIIAKRNDMEVARVLVRRSIEEIAAISTDKIDDIVGDPAIDTVVEVMGGVHPAYEYIAAALSAGKNVVTANKAVISACYKELTALAAEKGVALRCTAAVGGGIPWLINLERCRRIDTVTEVSGIMNGTTNYIMDAMHKSPVAFADILKKAQELGYAEADPSADIDGDDIRRKLTISANIAFGALLNEETIPMFGIRTVTDGDIVTFQSEGYVCKLIATARKTEGGVAAWLEPTLLDSHALEAAVPANYNLISFQSEYLGRQSYYGQGAGRYPTASNVVQDCVDILQGTKAFYANKAQPMLPDNSGVAHAYYVRCAVTDRWLESVTEKAMGSGVVTAPVSVETMLHWAKAKLAEDPALFIAAIG